MWTYIVSIAFVACVVSVFIILWRASRPLPPARRDDQDAWPSEAGLWGRR